MRRRLLGGGCDSGFGGGATAGPGTGHVRDLQLRRPRGGRLRQTGGEKAASVYTTTGEHLNLFSLDITGIFDGNPFDLSKTYGEKSGLSTFTCTQHFEADQELIDITLVVGLVPPE